MGCMESIRNNFKIIGIAAIVTLLLSIIIIIALFFVLGEECPSSSNSTVDGNDNATTPATSGRQDGGDKSVPAPSPSGPAPVDTSKLEEEGFEDYEIAALNEVNKLRKKHGSPPLKLTKELNEIAKKCFEYYEGGGADLSCPYKVRHDDGFYRSKTVEESSVVINPKPRPNSQAVVEAIGLMYGRMQNYDFNKAGFQPNAAHFTTLVWKSTKEFGVYIQKSQRGKKGLQVFLTYFPHTVSDQNIENVAKPMA